MHRCKIIVKYLAKKNISINSIVMRVFSKKKTKRQSKKSTILSVPINGYEAIPKKKRSKLILHRNQIAIKR